MNQMIIGALITKKREQKNITQNELADHLGVSVKTVERWESGKTVPDYRVIMPLCDKLGVSLHELLTGKSALPENSDISDTLLELLSGMQSSRKQCTMLYGVIMMILGMTLLIVQFNLGGTDIANAVALLLLIVAIIEILIGIYIAARGMSKMR